MIALRRICSTSARHRNGVVGPPFPDSLFPTEALNRYNAGQPRLHRFAITKTGSDSSCMIIANAITAPRDWSYSNPVATLPASQPTPYPA